MEQSLHARLLTYSVFLLAMVMFAQQLVLFLPERTADAKTATIVFSGPLALESSQLILNSVKLALADVNYKIGDIELRLLVLEGGDETGAWVPEKEESNARKAVALKDVVAYFGPLNSGAAKISMPILNEAKIVQMSPVTTWPGLTKIGFQPGEPGIFYPTGVRHFVRLCTTDDLQGPAGAAWADSLGFKSVYILDDGDSYGVGIARLFEAESKRRNIRIAGTMSISAQTDFTAVTQSILASGAELVYFGGITPNGAPEMVRALKNAKASFPFMGPDGIYEEDFLTRAGDAAEGVYVTSVGVPPTEMYTRSAEQYVEKYREEYGEDPDAFSALAYDGTRILIGAIRNAGKVDSRDVLREVRDTREYPGLSGLFGFDKNGDTTAKLISGAKVENGAFTFVKTLAQ